MPRKKNATRSDGRIQTRIYIGKDESGKKKYKYVMGYTQKEVDAKAAELRAKLGRGIDLLAQNDTFGEWRSLWWLTKKNDLSTGSRSMYESLQSRLSSFDRFPISRIRTADINAFLIKSAEDGLSHGTLRKLRMTASQIFNYAIQNRVIDFNPADYAAVPDGSGSNKRRALSEDEQRIVRELPHRAQTAAMIMMYAGLRRGEFLALTWSDIDMQAKTITVNKSVEFIDGGNPHVKFGAKTDAGNRIIPMPDILIDYLSNVQRKTLIVCPSASGKYMSETSWRRMWHSYMLDINAEYGAAKGMNKRRPGGIPLSIEFTAHYLRHTYATLLYKSGVDVLTAQYLLGHADVKTTLSIYTHLDEEQKQYSVDRLNKMLSERIAK